jgi:mono/diheme cytochrome c family protein
MKNYIIIIISLIAFTGCKSHKKEIIENQTLTGNELIERGAYLVNTIGCADCHSAKVFGPMGPMVDTITNLGGHIEGDISDKVNIDALSNWALFNYSLTATVGPWGISYAANITSDATGIGNWSEEQFLRAMKEGKYKGLQNSRMLLPPMPWQNYGQMSDEDLKAIYAYLKTTKPVKNVVPPPVTFENLKSKV